MIQPLTWVASAITVLGWRYPNQRFYIRPRMSVLAYRAAMLSYQPFSLKKRKR